MVTIISKGEFTSIFDTDASAPRIWISESTLSPGKYTVSTLMPLAERDLITFFALLSVSSASEISTIRAVSGFLKSDAV